jgi:hypothetical protein
VWTGLAALLDSEQLGLCAFGAAWPPELKPVFEKIVGEPPDSQHAGPAEKPTFVRVSDGVPRWLKLSAAIATVVGAVFAALAFFFAGGVSERDCKTVFGGITVCGNYYDQRVQ